MSADKYPSIFSRQMLATVYLIYRNRKRTVNSTSFTIILKRSGKRTNSVKKAKFDFSTCQNEVAMAMPNNAEEKLTHQNGSEE